MPRAGGALSHAVASIGDWLGPVKYGLKDGAFGVNRKALENVLEGMVSVLRYVVVLAVAVAAARAQPLRDSAGGLPEPGGKFRIGRVTLVCEDPSRLEPLDPDSASRRIAVDVWYPADPPAERQQAAVYLDAAAFEQELGREKLASQLGRAYDAIRAGRVVTHAVEGAPFASSIRRAPVLLFSPGGGMIRELYTSQLEDLASHGYVVAAMTHSYDGLLSLFPDGTRLRADARRWPRVPSVEGEANLNQLEWHTDDLLAVLDQLTRLNGAEPSQSPLAGRLDLRRVGAFGHSFGGVAAAHACQKDRRIQACLNQDGAMGMKPFYLDAQGWGMNQAFLLLERPPNREPLTNEDLRAMKLTRERAEELIARLNRQRDRTLQSTGTGSYRVLLRRSATTHMDFSDLRLLSAENGSQRDQRLAVLALVTSYTRAFFDRHVRGVKASLLDRAAPNEILESVETFRPSKARN